MPKTRSTLARILPSKFHEPWIVKHFEGCRFAPYRLHSPPATRIYKNAHELCGFYAYETDTIFVNTHHPAHISSREEMCGTIVHEIYHRASRNVSDFVGSKVDELMARTVEAEVISGRRKYLLRSRMHPNRLLG